jgi:hypothetical protein
LEIFFKEKFGDWDAGVAVAQREMSAPLHAALSRGSRTFRVAVAGRRAVSLLNLELAGLCCTRMVVVRFVIMNNVHVLATLQE